MPTINRGKYPLKPSAYTLRVAKNPDNKMASRGYVKRMINKMAEPKSHEQAISATGDYSGGTVVQLTAIAQGDGESNRDGNEIRITSLFMRMFVGPSSTNVSDSARLIVFQDFSPDGSLVLSDVLETTGAASVMYSCYNTDNSASYNVLIDKTYTFYYTWNRRAHFFKKYIKFKNPRRIKYTGSAGASYGKGQIKAYFCSDSASLGCTFNGNVRVQFLDM